MLDFTITETSFGLNLYCLVIFLFMVVSYHKTSLYGNTYSVVEHRYYTSWSFLFFFFVASLTFFVNADFFHYMEMVKDYEFDGKNHGEEIYGTIIYWLDKNYFLFRVCVWGGALWLLIKTFTQYAIDKALGLYIVLLLFFIIFSYSRATLAMAMFFYGFSLLTSSQESKNVYSLLGHILFGVLFMGLSYLFHHSIIVLIVMSFFLWIPVNRVSFIFYVLFYLIILLLFETLVSDLFLSNFIMEENEYVSERVNSYLSKEYDEYNLLGAIQSIYGYSIFYLSMIIITKYFLFQSHVSYPKFYRLLYKLTLLIFVLATTLFLVFDLEQNVFFYRILYMSFIPITILLAYLYQNNILSKNKMIFILLWGGGYMMWVLVRSVYIFL